MQTLANDFDIGVAEKHELRPAAELCYGAFEEGAAQGRLTMPFPNRGHVLAQLFGAHYNPASFVMVARSGQEVVGVIVGDGRDEFAALSSLAVSPDHRKSGVATELFGAAWRHASQEFDPAGVAFTVDIRNLGAIRIYERQGFTSRANAHPVPVALRKEDVRSAVRSDLAECIALAKSVTGFGLCSRISDAIEADAVWVLQPRDSGIRAYVTRCDVAGHAVARTPADLGRLLRSDRRGSVMLVPDNLVATLGHAGSPAELLSVMARGEYVSPLGCYIPSFAG